MVVVSISEMYDMRTEKGKMALIGVHTPNMGQIMRRWLGLCLNYRFYKILGADVSLSCAAMMPADPLQVGVDSDEISPQDLMNPILYRAMTNETWNTVLSRLYGRTAGNVDQNSIKAFNDAFSALDSDTQEAIYYTLLSLPEWKKAMPQQGLTMRNLRPLVFPIYANQGEGIVPPQHLTALGSSSYASDTNGTPTQVSSTTQNPNANSVRYYKGSARPMPRFPCTVPDASFGDPVNVVGDNAINKVIPFINEGRTYVCGILMPPARTKEMYFRMRVVWHVEFQEICTIPDKSVAVGDGLAYLRSYSFSEASKAPESVDTGFLETVGCVDPKLIVEK